jgi:hypothetical protein
MNGRAALMPNQPKTREGQVMSLAEFLLAQIAEDEAAWQDGAGLVTRTEFAKFSRHMLAECEAKRRIVERVAPPDELHDSGDCSECDVTRLLALPYADHADYQPEWRV